MPVFKTGFGGMLDALAAAPKEKQATKPGLATKPGTTPDWYRPDGSQKGMGFLGPLKFKDGRTSTELSIGVQIDGKEVEIPSLVPTLTPPEIQHLLGGGEPTPEIVQKATDHAIERLKAGKSPFAGPEDYPQGQ